MDTNIIWEFGLPCGTYQKQRRFAIVRTMRFHSAEYGSKWTKRICQDDYMRWANARRSEFWTFQTSKWWNTKLDQTERQIFVLVCHFFSVLHRISERLGILGLGLHVRGSGGFLRQELGHRRHAQLPLHLRKQWQNQASSAIPSRSPSLIICKKFVATWMQIKLEHEDLKYNVHLDKNSSNIQQKIRGPKGQQRRSIATSCI